MCVCVWGHICVWVLVCTCMWNPATGTGNHPCLSTFLIEAGFRSNLELAEKAGLNSQLALGAPCLLPRLELLETGLTGRLLGLLTFVGSENLRSSPHACRASVLTTEFSCLPWCASPLPIVFVGLLTSMRSYTSLVISRLFLYHKWLRWLWASFSDVLKGKTGAVLWGLLSLLPFPLSSSASFLPFVGGWAEIRGQWTRVFFSYSPP